VDEAQDLSVPQLRFLAAVRGTARDGILFAGDTAQRIFREPFSWSSLGMEIRGRSRVLRVNYRTSQEIRVTIDRLLDDEIVDPEGLSERRDTTISLFRGPSPEVRLLRDMDEEIDVVSAWIRSKLEQGCPAEHIAVFVRSDRELDRAHQVLRMAGEVEFREQSGAKGGHAGVTVASMHEAKGLEFKVVAVMGCDDDVIPSLERIEQIGDEADLEEVYVTERNLLYVACSRAREALLITGVKPGSEFLEDME
jgi:superfamily I DNA/RNA helicase